MRSLPRSFGGLIVACCAMHAVSSSTQHVISSGSSNRRMAPRLPGIGQATPELGLAPGAVHDLALELAAGRVDVVAAGAADHGQHLRIEQDLLERADPRLVGTLVAGAGERIERNQDRKSVV